MDQRCQTVLGIHQNKWRYRKLYPGNLVEIKIDVDPSAGIFSTSGLPPSVSSPSHSPSINTRNHLQDSILLHDIPARRTRWKHHNENTAAGACAVVAEGLPLKMESFKKYESDVSDAWSTDAEDNTDSNTPRTTSHPTEASNTTINGHPASNSSSFRPPVNRLSSEHLRAKGLQRLALQSGSASTANRPGMAVRSASTSFTDHSASHTATAGLEFLPRNAQKAEKFEKLLSMRSIDMEELRKLSWSGVPSHLRARVWRILTGYLPPVGDDFKLQESLDRKREEYRNLVSEYYPKREDDQYKDTFRQIHIDVPRMCPLIPLFQQVIVQEIFERILFIWALRNPASGYVQGINDLVTPYFIVFLRDHIPAKEAVENCSSSQITSTVLMALEADSFWCLSKLLAGIQNNYTFAQPGIQQRVIQLKELIQRVDVDLNNHLEKCSVEYLQFSFRWMNNLLIRELPLKCIIRLWDTYHSESDGFANFHIYVCASFLLWWSEDLRSQPDFQYSLLLLQNLPTQNWSEDEIERLLAKAFFLKYTFADAPSHLKSF